MSAPDDAPSTQPARAGLRRAMGLRDTALFFVVAVASPRWIATAAAAGPSSLVIWLIALLTFFVPLALAVIELSSRFPEEGGIYVWTRRTFGESAGFMTAWMYWVSNLVYFPGLLYFTAGNALAIAGPAGARLANSAPWFIGFSLAGLALAFTLNVVGLRVGKWLHNVGAYATWVPIVILIALAVGALARFGPATDFRPASLMPATGIRDIVFWSTIAFAFAGFEAASLMGDEIADARRTIPRAILISGVLIVAIYVLGTAAVLVALPPAEVSGLSGIIQAIERAGGRLGLPIVGVIAAVLLTVANLGGVGAWLAAVARLPFVAGIDRYLPAEFGRLHPRWGTPVLALVVQTVGAAVFIVLGQAGATVEAAYDALVSMAVITYFIPFLYMFAALVRVQRVPAGPDVMRVPGGPPVAIAVGIVGFATTTLSIALALVPPAHTPNPPLEALKVAGSSALLIAIGGLLYWKGRRRDVS
jgi:amino acid transporter